MDDLTAQEWHEMTERHWRLKNSFLGEDKLVMASLNLIRGAQLNARGKSWVDTHALNTLMEILDERWKQY